MELDKRIKAQELKRQLEEKAMQSNSHATFDIFEEKSGTNKGAVYVRKEKPEGEVVLYSVEIG